MVSDVRKRLVADAVRHWHTQSVDLSGRNRLLYYRPLKVGTLDLDSADEQSLRGLLTGAKKRLSHLYPDQTEFDDAVRRCRAIRARATQSQEEKGIDTLRIALGMVTWDSESTGSEPQAPLLLSKLELSPRGRLSADFDLVIGEEWELNPSLVLAINSEFHTNLDTPDILERLSQPMDSMENLTQLHDLVEKQADDIRGFEVQSSVIVGNFSYLKIAQAERIEAFEDDIADHTLLAAIAGDVDARNQMRERIVELSGSSIDEIHPSNEFLILDADLSQNMAINAAAKGQDMVVVGPPGTGKSQTIANLIATLTANGKRTLFVAEKRAAIDAVVKRLDSVGLKDIVLDLHEGASARRQVAKEVESALDLTRTVTERTIGDLHRRLTSRRTTINRFDRAVHQPREPWNVSIFNAQSDLIGITDELHTEFKFRDDLLESLTGEVMDRVTDEVRQLAELGAFGLGEQSTDPWSSAFMNQTITSGQQVRDVIRALDDAVQSQLARVEDRIRSVSLEIGILRPDGPTKVTETIDVLSKIQSLSDVLDFSVFDESVGDLLEKMEPGRGGVFRRLIAHLGNSDYRNAKKSVDTYLIEAGSVSAAGRVAILDRALELQGMWEGMSTDGRQPTPSAELDSLATASQQLQQSLNLIIAASDDPTLGSDTFESTLVALERLREDRDTLFRIPEMLQLKASLQDMGLGPFLAHLGDMGIRDDRSVQVLMYVWLSSIVEHVTIEERRLSGFSAESHDSAVEDYRSLDNRHIASGAARVRRAWAERAVAAREAHPDEASIVSHQARLERRHMPTREFLHNAPNVLAALKPCWIMSPLVVAELLPRGTNFDVVIFDEASQILPADAVLSILQGNQLVVAGDSKQLPPTTFFTSFDEDSDDTDQEDDETVEDDGPDPQEVEKYETARVTALTQDLGSILDVMEALLPRPLGTRTLEWHYRSEDERLIAFSNAQPSLYDSSLTTFPGARGEDCISHILVERTDSDAGPLTSSSAEVRKVVELVLDHATNLPNRSLGVIALGLKHAMRIEESLRLARRTREDLDDFFNDQREEGFFVKNLERVQGDERDSIILSVGYDKFPDGRMRYVFGPINSIGGERRLNVAVTRARKSVTLVTSFDATDMDPDRLRSEGARMLKSYIEYAASNGTDLGMATLSKPELNPFERDVRDALVEEGISLISQYGASGYWIDFACMHPERPGEPVLAIETDGASYHSSQSARDRDRLRQEHLERLGWQFHRIWSTGWFRHKEFEVKRALEAYRRAVRSRDGGSESNNLAEVDPPRPRHDGPTRQELPKRDSDWPPVPPGRKTADYSRDDLRRTVNWVQSDGLLRTTDELASEVITSLGFGRKGHRITEAVGEAIKLDREHAPMDGSKSGKKANQKRSIGNASQITRKSSSKRPARRQRSKSSDIEIRKTLQDAYKRGRPVAFSYVNAQGRASTRTLEISQLRENHVAGIDSLSGELRTFRISRIRSSHVTVAS